MFLIIVYSCWLLTCAFPCFTEYWQDRCSNMSCISDSYKYKIIFFFSLTTFGAFAFFASLFIMSGWLTALLTRVVNMQLLSRFLNAVVNYFAGLSGNCSWSRLIFHGRQLRELSKLNPIRVSLNIWTNLLHNLPINKWIRLSWVANKFVA